MPLRTAAGLSSSSGIERGNISMQMFHESLIVLTVISLSIEDILYAYLGARVWAFSLLYFDSFIVVNHSHYVPYTCLYHLFECQ